MEQRLKPPRPDLIQKFLEGTATPEERDMLEQWYISMDHSKVEWPSNDPAMEESDVKERLWQLTCQGLENLSDNELLKRPALVRRLPNGLYRWIIAAVITALVAGGGIYIYSKTALFHSKPGMPSKTALAKQDIAPGGNKAVLTLANGTRIVLDNRPQGKVSQQGNTQVLKLDSGQIAYTAGARSMTDRNSAVLYNMVSTPRGGQYKVILPDGSLVWLNAASSLRFPTAFDGPDRVVELTGEGYFEIAKNISHPFHVKVGKIEVQVLGTHFDIMAYEDEPAIRTTLLEGVVKVKQGSQYALLKPGQRAEISGREPIKVIKTIDPESAIAWKNGCFEFSSDDMETIMRQVARWYDVDVVYEGKKPAGHFSGDIGRNSNVSEVLKLLELNQVHFRIEGKRIIVLP